MKSCDAASSCEGSEMLLGVLWMSPVFWPLVTITGLFLGLAGYRHVVRASFFGGGALLCCVVWLMLRSTFSPSGASNIPLYVVLIISFSSAGCLGMNFLEFGFFASGCNATALFLFSVWGMVLHRGCEP